MTAPKDNDNAQDSNAVSVESTALLDAPVRLCCGQRHFGPVCPDGMVMCCLCFERVSQDKLNVASNGQKEDVCNECAERESASNKGLKLPAFDYCSFIDEDYKLLGEFFNTVYRHTQGEKVELKDIEVY